MTEPFTSLPSERENILPHIELLAADLMFGVQSTGYIQRQYLNLPRLHLYLGFLPNVHSQQIQSLSRQMSSHSQQQAHLLYSATENECTKRLKYFSSAKQKICVIFPMFWTKNPMGYKTHINLDINDRIWNIIRCP